ncbi:MAG TPA: hypothetical protein VGI05_10010 [Streptosporangiaceae bacterium]
MLPALADAFGATFWVALGLTAASLAAALALPGRPAARQPAVPQARQNPEPATASRSTNSVSTQ